MRKLTDEDYEEIRQMYVEGVLKRISVERRAYQNITSITSFTASKAYHTITHIMKIQERCPPED